MFGCRYFLPFRCLLWTVEYLISHLRIFFGFHTFSFYGHVYCFLWNFHWIFLLCPTLVTRRKTSFSISLLSSKLTISTYSIYKHDAIDIVDPNSMQDACHMNFVIDPAHQRVSVAQIPHGNSEFVLYPTLAKNINFSLICTLTGNLTICNLIGVCCEVSGIVAPCTLSK